MGTPAGCVAFLTDGRMLSGTLERVDPDQSVVVMVPQQDTRLVSLAFDGIKVLHLTEPVDLLEDSKILDAPSDEVFPPTPTQDFEVVFPDGEKLSGTTRGYFKADFGLFLFRVNEDGYATRSFVPAASLGSWRIGPKIGDMLVAEKVATPEQIEKALEHQQALRNRRLGDYLSSHEVVTPEQMAAALERQKAMPMKRLGEVLLEMGLVTEQQLSAALAAQKGQPSTPLGEILLQLTEERISAALDQQKRHRATPLGQILVEMGVVDEATLKDVLARKLGIPVVNLSKFKIDPNAVRLVDAAFAREHCLIPIQRSPEGLVVATQNPLDQASFERLRFLTQQQVLPVIANRAEIEAALETYHGAAHGAHA
ncbi:MAG TPA: hypothetical protein VF859_05510, partial [Burkholderiales bacterium]